MTDPDRRVLLSLVLCSRNDSFQGDSLWRLGTSLNYLARQLAALGRLADVEVIVTDWGSAVPLREVTALTGEAESVVRFLTVGVDLARQQQGDSPFAEVIAINAAVRRARGEYIGRIDQDTLVGRRFLEWFFDAVEHPRGEPAMESTVMVSNRRRIPYHFAVATPPFPVVERYIDAFGASLLPRMTPPPADRYWQCYIGILLFHRKLWEECEGYDESFLYYGFMEFDLFLRLRTAYEGRNIGPLVGHDFFHLDHVRAWRVKVAQARRENAVVRSLEAPPERMAPNGPGWGLAEHDLALESSAGAARLSGAQSRWAPEHRAPLVRLALSSAARTLGQAVAGYTHALPGWLARQVRHRR
ncbi:MAG: hypothetical protein ACT4RN_21575 [Pseudonocardia sp.]